MNRKELGRAGGLATVRKHGKKHMRRISRRGGRSTAKLVAQGKRLEKKRDEGK